MGTNPMHRIQLIDLPCATHLAHQVGKLRTTALKYLLNVYIKYRTYTATNAGQKAHIADNFETQVVNKMLQRQSFK